MAPDNYRKALFWQRLIALVFLGLGGWCLVVPSSIVELTVLPEHRNELPLTTVTIGAFGAQAMLVGLVSATSRYTAATFLALGIALLPFFIFDWWFYALRPLFNEPSCSTLPATWPCSARASGAIGCCARPSAAQSANGAS